MKRVIAVLLLACGVTAAYAQSASDVANGTAFANSIKPTSPSQIVNPTGVSSSTWGNQTGISSSVPTGLGGFSNPNTASDSLNAAKNSNLTAFGRQAESYCASYTPGSDPYQNQYCAAVNFLNEQCMTPTGNQKSVLGATSTQFGSSANCAGTYGAGQGQYNYGNEVTSSAPIFQVIGNLGNTATDTLTQTCTSDTVVTQPAQYAYNTCTVSTDEEENACSQYLSAKIVNTINQAISTESCPGGGSLVNGACQNQYTYAPTITCPAGYIQSGANQCVQTNTLAASMTCPSDTTPMTISGNNTCMKQFSDVTAYPPTYEGMDLVTCYAGTCWFLPLKSCPSGYSWDGAQCIQTITVGAQYNCPSGGSVQGQSCVSVTQTAPTITYSCPSGQSLTGTNCVKQTVTTTWTDTCGVYEQSAGSSLATPTN